MNKLRLLLSFVFFVGIVYGQPPADLKELLKPRTGTQQLVNDFAGILTLDQKYTIEQKLVAFDDSSSTQIAVVIIDNLEGNDVADYAVQLGRAWGIGGKEFSNGVLLLISVKDRKLNIATGYGVEGALPDITTKHIIDEVIVPNFKGNDYYRGIDEGTNAIIKAVQGEYQVPRQKKSKGRGGSFPFIIVIIILFLIFRSGGGGGKGGQFMSRRGSRSLLGPLILGNLLGRAGGGYGGGFGGGSSGGGGGFGGFGGGSFGGGGSSGSW